MPKGRSRRKGELTETELFGVVTTVRKEFFHPARLKALPDDSRGIRKAKAAKRCLAQFDVEKLSEWLDGNQISLAWFLDELLKVYRDPSTPPTVRVRVLEQFRAFQRVGASLHRSAQLSIHKEDPDATPRYHLPDPFDAMLRREPAIE